MNRTDARALLEIELATAFVFAPSGRLRRNNDPDGAAAPQMLLAGCADGNILRLNEAIDERVARTIETLAAREAPLDGPDVRPRFADTYRALLAIDETLTEGNFGLSFHLPNDAAWRGGATIVCHDTPQGEALCARLARDGLPPGLRDMGFADLTHFWAPWCVALDGDAVASIAFASRLGPQGASLGLATVPAFRGRGHGAAAAAAWSALPALRHRVLFYGTDRANISSQRVTQRLGLRFLGSSLRL